MVSRIHAVSYRLLFQRKDRDRLQSVITTKFLGGWQNPFREQLSRFGGADRTLNLIVKQPNYDGKSWPTPIAGLSLVTISCIVQLANIQQIGEFSEESREIRLDKDKDFP